jgi:hypothetical protein
MIPALLMLPEFLRSLLLAPVPLQSWWLALAITSLLAITWLLAWSAAFIHAKTRASGWSDLVVSRTKTRVSWAWGWCIASILLTMYAVQLLVRERLLSLGAAAPYVAVAIASVIISLVLQRGVRADVRQVQRALQEQAQ